MNPSAFTPRIYEYPKTMNSPLAPNVTNKFTNKSVKPRKRCIPQIKKQSKTISKCISYVILIFSLLIVVILSFKN